MSTRHAVFRRISVLSIAGLALGTISGVGVAFSDEVYPASTLNTFGLPGLVEMPTADVLPNGQLSATVSHFAGITRNTVTFQITPRLSGSFRYSAHISPGAFNFDRSFDFKYKILDEGKRRPALALGMQDVIGTGAYSGEYLVASKHFSPQLKVTGGIGWGRFATYGEFSNPLAVLSPYFRTRAVGFGLGGVPAYSRWFRGPAALFGGVEWQTPNPRVSVKAEYSSDGYTDSLTSPTINHRSPFNFALNYRFKNGAQLSAYYLYGSAVGVSGTFSINPRKPLGGGNREGAPLPVISRPNDVAYDTGWTSQPDGEKILRGNIQTLLDMDGQELEALRLSATKAEVRFLNKTRGPVSEAIGRVARVLSRVMPPSVETFVIIPVVKGMPLVAVKLRRGDIEKLENDPNGAAEILKKAEISDGLTSFAGIGFANGIYPHLDWAFKPYVMASFFDPDKPVRMDFGLRLEGEYDVAPGVILSGSVRKRVIGDMNTVTRVSNSLMPVHVRSDSGLYDNAGDPVIEHLTGELFFRPRADLFGRVTAGYLEKMYGGISIEGLWKPVDGKLAFGLEINAVKQRAFNQLLGFQNFGVVTGHASAYWDMGHGFYSQLDVGRYLAGDYGATFTLDRVFDNGWKIGAFFTLTDVPFSTFGEGSFDKGLRVSIPISWITAKPTRQVKSLVLRPLTRDGGARLEVRNRLYGLVEDYRGDRLRRRWGRFWR